MLSAGRLGALALVLLAAPVASVASGASAARAGEASGTPAAAPTGAPPAAAAPDDGIARLRFAWPAPLRARVTMRRIRTAAGRPASTFTARYETRVEEGAGALSVSSHETAWRGDLPFPSGLEADALRASERIVQRVGRDGRFEGLEGVEALRPVLARVFEDAEVPPDAAERALRASERTLRDEAEELWNLAVGFWAGADLRVGERYVLARDAEIPLLAGARAPHAVEFGVRRRVPCSAAEPAARCVEATLRATPEGAALAGSEDAVRARLGLAGAERPDAAPEELSAESELVLVTEAETLLPRRVVWTKALRLGPQGADASAELLERTEYDYRYPEREAAAPARSRRRSPAAKPRERPRAADAG